MLTSISWSFSTFALCSRHCRETHIVIGLVLGRGMRHAWLGFGLCLLPAVAGSLLPTAAAHGLGRGLLRRGGESSAHACWRGRFTGKRRPTCTVRGKGVRACIRKQGNDSLSEKGNLNKIPQAAGFHFPLCHKRTFATSRKALQLSCHCSANCLKDSTRLWSSQWYQSSNLLGKSRDRDTQLAGNHSCCVIVAPSRWHAEIVSPYAVLLWYYPTEVCVSAPCYFRG